VHACIICCRALPRHTSLCFALTATRRLLLLSQGREQPMGAELSCKSRECPAMGNAYKLRFSFLCSRISLLGPIAVIR
jgi:hypothetical protein